MLDPLTRLVLKIAGHGARSAFNHLRDSSTADQKSVDEAVKKAQEDLSARRRQSEEELARRKELELIASRQRDVRGEGFREILDPSIRLASAVLVFHLVTIGVAGAAIAFVAVLTCLVIVLWENTKRNPTMAIVKHAPPAIVVAMAIGVAAQSAGLGEFMFVFLTALSLKLVPEN